MKRKQNTAINLIVPGRTLAKKQSYKRNTAESNTILYITSVKNALYEDFAPCQQTGEMLFVERDVCMTDNVNVK